jgi:ATP-dependent DNA helicase RecQ
VYLTLKSLSQRHILHFIPQKKTPYIRYTQRREDKEHIQIMPDVYEERKAQFAERIQAMIRYATKDNICRSRQLLRYFGERNWHNCGQCDVCLSKRKEGMVSDPQLIAAAEAILKLLEDDKPHPITYLKSIELPDSELDAALDYLSDEEYIVRQDDGQISRNLF